MGPCVSCWPGGRGEERGKHYGLEPESLEHGEVDGKRIAAAVDAGCDELERQRGHDELAVSWGGGGGAIVGNCVRGAGGDREGSGHCGGDGW